jgi:hypothetical protein
VARGASEEQGTSDHISGMSPLLVVPAARTSDSEVPTVGRATAQTPYRIDGELGSVCPWLTNFLLEFSSHEGQFEERQWHGRLRCPDRGLIIVFSGLIFEMLT